MHEKGQALVASTDTLGLYKVSALVDLDATDTSFRIKLPDGTSVLEPAPFWERLLELNNLIEGLCLFDSVAIFYNSFDHYDPYQNGKPSFNLVGQLLSQGALCQALCVGADGQLTPDSARLEGAIERVRAQDPESLARSAAWVTSNVGAPSLATLPSATQLYAFAPYIAAEELGISHWPSAGRVQGYQANVSAPFAQLANELESILRSYQRQEAKAKRKRQILARTCVPLPPLLEILLHRAARPADIWFELLDLRDQFAPFRRRVRELAELAESSASEAQFERRRRQFADDVSRVFGGPVSSGHRSLQRSLTLGDVSALAAGAAGPVVECGVNVLRRWLFDSAFEKIENILSRRRVRVFYDVRDEFRRLGPAQLGALTRKHWGRDLRHQDVAALERWSRAGDPRELIALR